MTETTVNTEGMSLVLAVYANSEEFSVRLGDPDAAGVPGKHSLDQWSLLLCETAREVANQVYGGLDGSHQLTQEILLRLRAFLDELHPEEESRLINQGTWRTPSPDSGVSGVTIDEDAFLRELEAIAEEDEESPSESR